MRWRGVEPAPYLEGAHQIARHHLGPNARPVSAKLFDKSPARNWALGWHQDRTIAVRARAEVAGYGPWTVKDGIPHTVPPSGLRERTLTLRLHLDDVDDANSPLLVSHGTHRLGRIPEPEIEAAVARHGTHPCLVSAGDAWAYKTLILHASARAATPRRRRVLQLLYSAEELPPPLEWLGV